MPHDLLLFITWKTYASSHIIDDAIGQHLEGLLPRLAASEGALMIELAVVPNHVHVVVEFPPNGSLSRLAQRLKGASSRLVNRDGTSERTLRWDKGYDARTVARRHLPEVRTYLNDQGRKHRCQIMARWSGPGRVEKGQTIWSNGESTDESAA